MPQFIHKVAGEFSMKYLYILNETYTNGYSTEILEIISMIAILSGILVIVSKNPVVSVLFLIG